MLKLFITHLGSRKIIIFRKAKTFTRRVEVKIFATYFGVKRDEIEVDLFLL